MINLTIHLTPLTTILIVLYLLAYGFTLSKINNINDKKPLTIVILILHFILFSPIMIPTLFIHFGESLGEMNKLYSFFKKGN